MCGQPSKLAEFENDFTSSTELFIKQLNNKKKAKPKGVIFRVFQIPRKVLLHEGIAKESGTENTHIPECLRGAVFTLVTLPAERI